MESIDNLIEMKSSRSYLRIFDRSKNMKLPMFDSDSDPDEEPDTKLRVVKNVMISIYPVGSDQEDLEEIDITPIPRRQSAPAYFNPLSTLLGSFRADLCLPFRREGS